jgi:hypothetical protein
MQPWVCMLCGYRADADGECAGCKKGPLLDIRQEQVRELISDHEGRMRRRREGAFLWVGVAFGILAVLVMWDFAFYRKLRRAFFALPFFIDQVLLMAAFAYAAQVLLSKVLPFRSRFPEIK